MNTNWIIDTHLFTHPFTCLVAGPSQSGKSHLISNIIKYNSIIIDHPPQNIVYCYSAWQPLFDKIKQDHSNIEFYQGIKSIDDIDVSRNNLMIIDDLMTDSENNASLLNIFTVDSHHKNLSVFLLTQNLFSRGKFTRTMSLNTQYIIMFKNPRDKSQTNVLARQMFPNKVKFFLEAFTDATETKSHSYLFIDLKQSTAERNRVQTGIIPGEQRIIYTAK